MDPMELFVAFTACFGPLFVAMDAPGVVAPYLALTDGMKKQHRKKVLLQSMVTATGIGLAFMVVGEALFHFLHISSAHFKIAGGSLLFLISLIQLLSFDKDSVDDEAKEGVGAVPIGIPLITGPAVLTTTLTVSAQYGHLPAALAFIVNIVITGVVLGCSQFIVKVLGKAGTKTLGKIMFLFLAAMAAGYIRSGVLLLTESL